MRPERGTSAGEGMEKLDGCAEESNKHSVIMSQELKNTLHLWNALLISQTNSLLIHHQPELVSVHATRSSHRM